LGVRRTEYRADHGGVALALRIGAQLLDARSAPRDFGGAFGLSIEGYAKVKFCDHDRALARPKPMRRRHARSTRWPGRVSAADMCYGERRAAFRPW
jgi:hypothetical protein